MRISARVRYLAQSFLRFLASVGVGFLLITALASQAHAQTPPVQTPQQPASITDYAPNVDASVPKDSHSFAQVLMVDMLSAIYCTLAGVDPIRPNQPCLGVNPATGVYGYPTNQAQQQFGQTEVQPGGLVGAMAGYIGMMYTPTVSSSKYTEYIASTFGIVPSAFAQPAAPQTTNCNTVANESFGYGYCGLNPIFNTWKLVRDLAYALLVIAFVVLALGIMLRFKADPRTVMTLQNQIPRVIIAIILITFSYAIAGGMGDVMWTVTYMGINAISGGTVAQACDGNAQLKPFDQVANLYLLETPMNYTEHIFDDNCSANPFTMESGLGSLSGDVSVAISKALADLISSVIGLGPIDELGDNCGLFDPLECIGYAIGFIIQMIIKLIVLITLLIALVRIWFELLKTAVLFLIYTIGGPVWIVFGLIPGRPLGFEKWIRLIFSLLAAFPVVAYMLVFALVVARSFPAQTDPNSIFLPPLIGNPNMEGFGSILAFGLILITPAVPSMLREKMKVPPGKLGGQIRSSIGSGGAVAAAAYGYPIKRLTRKYDHQSGRPAGVLRDWFSGRIASEKAGGKGTRWFRTVGKLIDGHTPLDKSRK